MSPTQIFTLGDILDFDGLDLSGAMSYSGVRYYAMAEGSTLSNPQPVDREITTSLIDGDYVVTDRYNNRQPAFQIVMVASNSALLDVGQARLFQAARKQSLLGWKPRAGWGVRRVYKIYTSDLQHDYDANDENRYVRAFLLKMNASPWAYAENEVVTVATSPPPAVPFTEVLSDGTSAAGWSSPASAAVQPASSGGKIVVATRRDWPAPVPGNQNSTEYIHDGWATEATLTIPAANFKDDSPYITMEVTPATGMRLWATPESTEGTGTGFNHPTFGWSYDYSQVNQNPRLWAAAFVDGVRVSMVSFTALPDGRSYRYTFRSADVSGTAIKFVVGTDKSGAGPSAYPQGTEAGVEFDNISRTNVLPGQSSTGRVSSLLVEAEGSARTGASISITHETESLGDTFFYSSPVLGTGGYSPEAMKYVTISLNETTEAAGLSGTRKNGDEFTPVVADVPISVLPSGPYLLAFRGGLTISDNNQDHLTVTVSQPLGNVDYGTTEMPGSLHPAPNSGVIANPPIRELGVLTLPLQKSPNGANGVVRIKCEGRQFFIDEILMFWLGDGADLTRVNCGNGAPALGVNHNNLFIDNPTPYQPDPGLYVGTLPDRSDAFDPGYPKVSSRGTHPLNPGSNKLFVVTRNATYPTITYRYVPASF